MGIRGTFRQTKKLEARSRQKTVRRNRTKRHGQGLDRNERRKGAKGVDAAINRKAGGDTIGKATVITRRRGQKARAANCAGEKRLAANLVVEKSAKLHHERNPSRTEWGATPGAMASSGKQPGAAQESAWSTGTR